MCRVAIGNSYPPQSFFQSKPFSLEQMFFILVSMFKIIRTNASPHTACQIIHTLDGNGATCQEAQCQFDVLTITVSSLMINILFPLLKAFFYYFYFYKYSLYFI